MLWLLMWMGCASSLPEVTETRLVSLQPQITETVFAMGAGDLVVGRSDYDTWPSEVQSLPAAGTALTPNVEAVVGMRPSHVLIEATEAARTDLLEPVATVEALPWQEVDELGPSIRRLGEITGRQDEAARIADDMMASLQKEPPSAGTRTLMVYASDDLARGPVWFVQRNSLHGAAMHAAGLRNAVDEDVSGAPSMPVERLIAVNPEQILILSSDDDMTAEQRERLAHSLDALTPLSAVQSGRIHVLASSRYHSTGPALMDFVDVLKAL